MSKLICKDCKGTDITQYTPGMFGEPRHRCNTCGKISITADFVVPDFFDQITASPEVLAEKLVYKTICVAVNRVTYSCWKSTITDESYRTKEEALAATVARLKEVER